MHMVDSDSEPFAAPDRGLFEFLPVSRTLKISHQFGVTHQSQFGDGAEPGQ